MTNLRTKPIDSLKTLFKCWCIYDSRAGNETNKDHCSFPSRTNKDHCSLPSGYNAKVVSSNSYLGLKSAHEMRAYQVMQVPFQY